MFVPVAMRIAVIALLAALFLVISFFLARWLTADNRERSFVTELLSQQAAGNPRGMLELMPSCGASAGCRREAGALASRFEGSGKVNIVRYDSRTARALGSERGPTRVAWQAGGPTSRIWVQCVEVSRSGVAFLGGKVELERIGPPIGGEASCPA
ncbi:MAG: hypothetical protein ACKOB9_05315 [Solirubrobacterales bacterium]